MTEKYLLSFTTGGLFFRESIKIAEIYSSKQNWDEVKQYVREANILQLERKSSIDRILREIISRLKCLSPEELNYLFLNADHHEQVQILWIAVFRKYNFIRDFMIHVVNEKFLKLSFSLTHDDFLGFFNLQAQWHEELAHLSDNTRSKLRQVLFRMMREAEILDDKGNIKPSNVSHRLIHLIGRAASQDLLAFPTHSDPLKRVSV